MFTNMADIDTWRAIGGNMDTLLSSMGIKWKLGMETSLLLALALLVILCGVLVFAWMAWRRRTKVPTAPRITFTAQKSLQDDGSIEFSSREEKRRGEYIKAAEKYLEKNYRDWLTAFHMVPHVFSGMTLSGQQSDSGKGAEWRVYCRLHELGKDLAANPMFVIHSFSFNENNQRGEIDFVIVSKKYGVMFMEVKAVSSQNTCSRYRFQKAEEQIKKARDALSTSLKVPGTSPAFVVMPNCPRLQDSKDAKKYEDCCFKEDCQDGKSFREWWDHRFPPDMTEDKLDEKEYKRLLCRFIGCRSAVPTLANDDVLQMFDKQQLTLVDNIGLPLHQLITGPAGSGKTSILLRKVKALDKDIRETGKREKILVLCYNLPLKEYFVKELEKCGSVTVETWTKLSYKLKNDADGKVQFDHVFVDEGQDLHGNWRELLEKVQAESECRRKFHWIFFDNHQHVRIGAKGLSPEDLDKAIELKKVYRMTGSVFEQFKKYLSVHGEDTQYSIGHDIIGTCIEWDKMDEKSDPTDPKVACEYISKRVKCLIDKKVCRPDICVLLRTHQNALAVMNKLKKMGIKCLDASESIKKPNNSAIIVDSIRRFKGLEKKVVIVYDPPCFGDASMKLLNTALSRSFCLVVIIAPEPVVRTLQSAHGGMGRIKTRSPQKTKSPAKGAPAPPSLVEALSALNDRFAREELFVLPNSEINRVEEMLNMMMMAAAKAKTTAQKEQEI